MKMGNAGKLSVDVIDVDEEDEVIPVRQQVRLMTNLIIHLYYGCGYLDGPSVNGTFIL